ncbi:MAG: albusnodin/ikarugamycin family macrolactam cyclase [Pseudonocardiaceae bacterium]
MTSFVGVVDPALGVGSTTVPTEQSRQWTSACPLWVLGTSSGAWQRHAAAPGVLVDVIGFSPASRDQVCSAAREFALSGDLMVLDSIASGSGALIVREPQRVTVLTDLAGVWPVFYTTVGGSLVYSSSVSVVARYAGNEVDEQWLAARLLVGGMPAAWSDGSPYQRVAAVPAGGVFLADHSGRAVVVRRDLPLGSLGFAEGAQRLAGALTTAVRGRMGAHRGRSADLSGGLDSSTVAALAATTGPALGLPGITLTCTDATRANLDNDDPVYARTVAAAVLGIKHVELPLPIEVEPYSALAEMPHTDEPFEDASIFARLRWWMTTVHELGGQVHLTGDGGDAVLTAPPAYLGDLVGRRSELWSHAAGWAQLRHRPVHRVVGAARRLASTTPASAVESYARALEQGGTRQIERRRWEDLIAWIPPLPAAHWFTAHARALAATALRNARCGWGDGAAPGDVASLRMIQAYGRAHRIHLELAAGRGVAVHAPFLDDAVVAACLAVPSAQRTSPRQAKPLLRAAMTGRVPDAALVRKTKGDYSMLAYRGLSRHHRTVAGLLTGSRLAGLGLVDEKAIRADLALGAAGQQIPLATLDRLLGTEIWLRTRSTSALPTVDRRQWAHA